MYRTFCVAACYLGVLLLVTFCVVIFRRKMILTCNELISKMYPHQLSGLASLIEMIIAPADVWEQTHGYKGLWCRWRNSTYLVQLCQLYAAYDTQVSKAELEYVTVRASLLAAVTFKAAVLGTVRFAAKESAAAASLRALKIYAEISDRTYTFYDVEDAPLCAQRLASIL